MTDFAIQTDSLTRRFRRTLAVDGVSLRVPPGSVYGYLGRNGTGKTTTIQMLMGMLSPTSGTLCILGMNPSPESDRAAGRRQRLCTLQPVYCTRSAPCALASRVSSPSRVIVTSPQPRSHT